MNANNTPLAFALSLSLSLLVGACNPVISYTESEAQTHLALDAATTQVDLRFVAGSAVLTRADALRLRHLAATGAISRADRVIVAASGGPRLAEQRIGTVAAELLRYGIVASGGSLVQVHRDRAVVEVGRTLVTLPACPNWSKPPSPDYGNTLASNYGCATEVNLGMMVASPTDLASGRPLGPAVGQPATAAMTRYLTDKVTPLPSTTGATPFTAAASATTAASTPGSP